VALRASDEVLFYTDGLMDNRDASGAWIDLVELIDVVSQRSAADGPARLLQRLESRCPHPADDLALLLLAVE
jgi:serine phosphatase RsbU (regulator of sigma subunit)